MRILARVESSEAARELEFADPSLTKVYAGGTVGIDWKKPSVDDEGFLLVEWTMLSVQVVCLEIKLGYLFPTYRGLCKLYKHRIAPITTEVPHIIPVFDTPVPPAVCLPPDVSYILLVNRACCTHIMVSILYLLPDIIHLVNHLDKG